MLPVSVADQLWVTTTIGASGAVYGVLLAFGLYFPNRPILIYFIFPIPAKYLVLIMGGIALMASMSDGGGGVAHTTHLGGLVVGYLYLKRLSVTRGRMGRVRAVAEIKYRYLRWKLDRSRRRVDGYPGSREDEHRVH